MNIETAESSVTAFFSKLADTWNTNDGAAFADFFTEDGSLINPFGERAAGRGCPGSHVHRVLRRHAARNDHVHHLDHAAGHRG
jgi:uncharacterized protein (TIGR02246 family)